MLIEERNEYIFEQYYLTGKTHSDLGKENNLSRERTRQIISRQTRRVINSMKPPLKTQERTTYHEINADFRDMRQPEFRKKHGNVLMFFYRKLKGGM